MGNRPLRPSQTATSACKPVAITAPTPWCYTQRPMPIPHAALPTTLLMSASRIRRLLKTTFYGTNTLPAMTGLLLSVGGSTMELVMGRELMATFMFEDPNGKFRFRVWERFALRL